MFPTLLLLALAGCASQPPRPARLAPARPLPVVTPPAAPLPWLDAALAPGRWRYERTNDGTRAVFGEGALAVRCVAAQRTVLLERGGAATATALTLTTTYGARSLAASAGAAAIAARDPLLDQLAFSRGRFMVEVAGQSRLIVPAWAEPARVIEDCRSGAGASSAP